MPKLNLNQPLPLLKKLYLLSKKKYYEDPDGKTVLTDAEFDRLEDHLKEVAPDWKGFAAGAPVQKKKSKVKLPIEMFSLDKVKDARPLTSWIADNPSDEFIVMDKLDGSSLELIYKKGVPSQLITRGNGKIGGDISFLIPHLNIPSRVENKDFIVRCEGLFSKAAFEKYKHEFDAARNAASGLLNRKLDGTPVHKAMKDLQLVALSLLSPNPKPSDGLSWLKKKGFRVVAFKVFKTEDMTFDRLNKLLNTRKRNGLFGVDGLVISYNTINRLPTSGNPSWSIAFKQNVSVDDAPITTITNIVWKVSSHGYIIPKFQVEPIQVEGATIRNAAAKNPKFCIQRGLGVGAQVGLVRSGEIIPEIVKVYKKAKFTLPDPSEFGAYHWDKTQTHIVLDDPSASGNVRTAKIARTFTTLGIDFLRGATVNKLVDAGFDNVGKILRASKEDFLSVEGFKEASAAKLWNAIHSKADQGFPLTTVMDASGVFPRGVGKTRLDMIAERYSLLELALMPKKDVIGLISAIPKFQKTTAEMVANGLPLFAKWMQKTRIKIAEPKKIKVKLSSRKLEGQSVTFTGFRDKDAELKIVENGGQVISFGSKTTILLVSPTGKASGKADKAREKGIEVLTLDQLYRKYKL